MSTFTTNAFNKAAAAWTEAQSGSLWTPDASVMAESGDDNPTYQPLVFNSPPLNFSLQQVTLGLSADMLQLDAALQTLYVQMFNALQPTQALQQAMAQADALIGSSDIGAVERLRDEYNAMVYDPLAGMKQLGLSPTAPQRDSTVRASASNAFDSARTKALRERALMLKTKKVALAVELITMTRELVMAEIEARLQLLTTASTTIQKAKLQVQFATQAIEAQMKQLRYQGWKLEEGNTRKQVALYKAQARYERIALKSGMSADWVQSIIASAGLASAAALNSVSFGETDSDVDKISYDFNNPPGG